MDVQFEDIHSQLTLIRTGQTQENVLQRNMSIF